MERVNEAVNILIEKALGIDATEMVIQIASTLLLFLVVKIFFWSKITDYLEKRNEHMKKDLKEANLAKENANLLKSNAEEELQEIRLNAKSIIEEAKFRGEEERRKIIETAKEDANTSLENSRKEIASDIEKARRGIKEEIVEVATLMAEKIVKREIDQSKHDDILDDILNEVNS